MSDSDTGQGSSGPSLPKWLPRSREGFRNLVLGTVATWIVGGILSVWAGVVDSLLAIYGALNSALSILFEQLGNAGAIVLTGPSIVLETVDMAIQTLAANAGPLGPLVIVLLWGGVLVLLLISLRWIARGLWLLYNAIPIL